MKTLSILFFSLFIGGIICAGPLFDDTPYITKVFTLPDGGNLQVVTSGGDIVVVGHAGNSAKVEMIVEKSAGLFVSGDDIQEELEDYIVDIKKTGNTILAKAEKKSKGFSFGDDISISFKVYVPNKVSCNLTTSGGDIVLSKVIGRQKIQTSGGDLKLNSIRGDMVGSTSGGDIKVENYKGNMRATTSGGNIVIFEAKGLVDVETSGGNIQLKEVFGSIKASTSGGNINAVIKELGKTLNLSTSGGNIEASIPTGMGLDIDLRGSSVQTKLSNFTGESEEDKVVGKVNGGGVPVKMMTSGGSVVLNYL